MSKTISYKLSDEEVQKLIELLPSLPPGSIHTAAKYLMMLSLLSLTPTSTAPSSPSPAEAEVKGNGIASQHKLLAMESDIHQVILSIEEVASYLEKLGLYALMLTELLLINVGDVSEEAASAGVRDIFNVAFGGTK